MTSKASANSRPVYDTFHMGRSCMDLYSNDLGADFVDIRSFAAYVGGSPTNMSVGCRRLGLQSALLTAFGEDPVGDFVAHFLTAEGVDIRFWSAQGGTSYQPGGPGHRTAGQVPFGFLPGQLCRHGPGNCGCRGGAAGRQPRFPVRRHQSEPRAQPQRHPARSGDGPPVPGRMSSWISISARTNGTIRALTGSPSGPCCRGWTSCWEPKTRSMPPC